MNTEKKTDQPNTCDITVVLQGPIIAEMTPKSLSSIRKWLPEAKIVVSSWEGSDLTPLDPFDVDIVLSVDPGCKPRGVAANSKPNNVNRQIVSSIAGLKAVRTKYALKLRTDFVVRGRGFLDAYDSFPEYDLKYKIFECRVIVSMFGTRKPRGNLYNLAYHVSDFIAFGETADLLNLYDIDLVTDEEFNYFNLYPEKPRDTYAVNLYNAEQSIIINWLKKNGRHVLSSYSTHIDDAIVQDSDKYLVNNFYPMSFRALGLYPLKDHLLPRNNIQRYSDYYTRIEWIHLYERYVTKKTGLTEDDWERQTIEKICRNIAQLDKVTAFWKRMPVILGARRLRMAEIRRQSVGDEFENSF